MGIVACCPATCCVAYFTKWATRVTGWAAARQDSFGRSPRPPKYSSAGVAAMRQVVERLGWTFRIGDRVIQAENDYNRDVFNGDLGVIEKMDGPFGMMAVRVVIV